jgi:hypothetical protein
MERPLLGLECTRSLIFIVASECLWMKETSWLRSRINRFPVFGACRIQFSFFVDCKYPMALGNTGYGFVSTT